MDRMLKFRLQRSADDTLECFDSWILITTVEPPNKGHVGDNINSAVVSFVERLSSSRRFKMY